MKDGRRIPLILLSVAAIGVSIVVAWRTFGGAAGPATTFQLVCVRTGEVFELDIDDAPMLPARNPKTGERTLLPCERLSDGRIRIVEDFEGAVRNRLAELNRVVDTNSFIVETP